MKLITLVIVATTYTNGGFYVDQIETETDLKFCNASFTLINDSQGDYIVNGAFEYFKTVTKVVFYVKFRIAEDKKRQRI